METAVHTNAHGKHFNEHGLNPRAQEVLVLAGSLAFALGGGFSAVMLGSSVVMNGSSALTSSQRVLATIGDKSLDSKKPVKDSTPASGDPSDAAASVGTSDKRDDETDTPDASQGKTEKPALEPEPETSAETKSATQPVQQQVVHLISRGETLSGISAKYGVSIDRIAIENQIRDVNLIYAGSALVIPGVTN